MRNGALAADPESIDRRKTPDCSRIEVIFRDGEHVLLAMSV